MPQGGMGAAVANPTRPFSSDISSCYIYARAYEGARGGALGD